MTIRENVVVVQTCTWKKVAGEWFICFLGDRPWHSMGMNMKTRGSVDVTLFTDMTIMLWWNAKIGVSPKYLCTLCGDEWCLHRHCVPLEGSSSSDVPIKA